MMGKIIDILPRERRNQFPDEQSKKNGGQKNSKYKKREKGYYLRDQVENNLEFLKWDYNTTLDYLKDKEKKKLMMVGGSFAVFSVLVSVLSIASKDSLFTHDTMFLIIMLGIAIINLAIIKYIVVLKADCIVAMRQINCVRQAILSTIYARFHDKYPTEEKELYDSSVYWDVIGRHIKFQINNDQTRKQYEKFAIRWYSADLATIHFIAAYTVILSLYPVLTQIINRISEKPIEPAFSAALGAIGFGTAIVFSLIAIVAVNQGLRIVREQLDRDAGGKKSKHKTMSPDVNSKN